MMKITLILRQAEIDLSDKCFYNNKLMLLIK